MCELSELLENSLVTQVLGHVPARVDNEEYEIDQMQQYCPEDDYDPSPEPDEGGE
jgi:hypothetical protein